MYVKNGSVEPARPCCFPAAGCFFCLLTRKSRYLAFGVRIWWFLCEIVAKPGQNLNATGDAGQRKPKHLFSLWDSSATFGSGVG